MITTATTLLRTSHELLGSHHCNMNHPTQILFVQFFYPIQSNSLVVYNDIRWQQFLFQYGSFKLNDFNTVQPITFAKKEKKATEDKVLCRDDEFGL